MLRLVKVPARLARPGITVPLEPVLPLPALTVKPALALLLLPLIATTVLLVASVKVVRELLALREPLLHQAKVCAVAAPLVLSVCLDLVQRQFVQTAVIPEQVQVVA